jgi:hypothetical protein
LAIVLGAQTVWLNREVSGRRIFATAEIQLPGRIHSPDSFEGKVNRVRVNLMLRAENSLYVRNGVVAAQMFYS